MVEEIELLETVEKVDQRSQRGQDVVEADVVEIAQVVEARGRHDDVGLLLRERIADVVDGHQDRRLRAGLDQPERGYQAHGELEASEAVDLRQVDQRGDVAEAVDQFLQRDPSVGIGRIGVVKPDGDAAFQMAVAGEGHADEAKPRGHGDTLVRRVDLEAGARMRSSG